MGIVERLRSLLVGRRRVGVIPERPLAVARRLEALGKLEEATASYVEAGAMADVARLYELRAGSAEEASERLALLAQAVGAASGDDKRRLAVRRARLMLDLAGKGRFGLRTSELVALGEELMTLDEPALAAQAYELGGDLEGQTRALVRAGSVERLEAVLDADQERERATRRRLAREQTLDDLWRSGRRREALAMRYGVEPAELARVQGLLQEIELRRIVGPVVRLRLADEPLTVALGDELLVGRADAAIVVESPAVSRAHLRVRRGSAGPEVLDLGSSNGTTLGGARLDVAVTVPEAGALALVLGGEVPVHLERWQQGVRVELTDRVVHAPLGPLVVGAWRIEAAPDGFVELIVVEGEAFLGELRVGSRIQLCRGDVLRRSAASLPVLEVVG